MQTKLILVIAILLCALSIALVSQKTSEGYRPGLGGPSVNGTGGRIGIARSNATTRGNASRPTNQQRNNQKVSSSQKASRKKESFDAHTMQTGWGRRGRRPYINIINKNVNKNGYTNPFVPYLSQGWYSTYPYSFTNFPYMSYAGYDGYPSFYQQPLSRCFQAIDTFSAFGPYSSNIAGSQQWIDWAGRNGYTSVSLPKSQVSDHAVVSWLGECSAYQQTPPPRGYLTYDVNYDW